MTAPSAIIVGAGHAALRAALSMREAGHDGSITLIASEGVEHPYERPPLSKWSAGLVEVKPIVPLAQMQAADIARIAGEVVSVNPSTTSVTLQDGRVLTYDKLLLATGARARRLNPEITGGAQVHYLRDLADAVAIQSVARAARSALIIGGGFIGLELAASLRGLQIDVHVLEREPRLLTRAIPAAVAEIVRQLHVANGVQFHFGVQVARMTGDQTVLTNGTTLVADFVIAGVGSIPNTGLASDAGLNTDNGIVVDTYLRTSDPRIFAAGDCCAFPLYGDPARMTRLESWQGAGEQGAVAGRNMVRDIPEAYHKVPWFWSNQYDHVLQVAGLASPECESVARSYAADHHVSFGCRSDGTLDFACGIAPGVKIAKDIRFALKLIEAASPVDKVSLRDPHCALGALHRKGPGTAAK